MIATVVVSYKRPELLQRTLVSYLETVTLPFELLVVDNGGSEEALTVARDLGVTVLSFGANLFPGHSTNTGWDILIKGKRDDQIAYLHRSDNDVEYLPGWCDEVTRRFDENANLGQFGLRTLEEEGGHPNVGEIRGRGLLLGVELVADRETRAPFPRSERLTERIVRAAREAGVLLYSGTGLADGTNGDAIVLGPPFVVTDDELATIADRLTSAIEAATAATAGAAG